MNCPGCNRENAPGAAQCVQCAANLQTRAYRREDDIDRVAALETRMERMEQERQKSIEETQNDENETENEDPPEPPIPPGQHDPDSGYPDNQIPAGPAARARRRGILGLFD